MKRKKGYWSEITIEKKHFFKEDTHLSGQTRGKWHLNEIALNEMKFEQLTDWLRPESGPRKSPGDRFEAFLVPARKVSPEGLQRTVLKHFWPQPRKRAQEASRGLFWSISGPSPENEPRRSPEDRFEAFLVPARKVSPGGLQRTVLKHFWPQPIKWAQEAPGGVFWDISGPSPESEPRRYTGDHFEAFLVPAQTINFTKQTPQFNRRYQIEATLQPFASFLKGTTKHSSHIANTNATQICWIEAPLQPFASFSKACYRSSHKQSW